MIPKLEAEAHQQSRTNPIPPPNAPKPSTMQNIIYTIVNHLKTQPTAIKDYYTFKSKQSAFRKHFFMALAELIKLYEHQEREFSLLLNILDDLLKRENYSPQYLCLYPDRIFTTLFKIDPNTFEHKYKRIYTKQFISTPQNNLCGEHSRGYAQVLLALVSYIQTESKLIQNVWSDILNIVGKYGLNVDRVMDMVLENLCDCRRIDRILPLVKLFNRDHFIILFSRKLMPAALGNTLQLAYDFPIDEIIAFSLYDLFFINKYPYNPRYLRIWTILLLQRVFTMHDFLPYLPHLTHEQMCELEENRLAAASKKVLGTMSFCIDEMTEEDKINQFRKDQIIFSGQALQCCKMAFLHQILQSNNFADFKQQYSQMWGQTRIDLIVYVPILKSLCELLEWIIDPLYYRIGLGKFFPHHKKKMLPFNFPEGYFHQTSEVNDVLFLFMDDIFHYLEIYVGLSERLFTKLCRLLSRIVVDPVLQRTERKRYMSYRFKIGNYISKYLMGGLSLKQYRCPAAYELYALLSLFKQPERFQFYLYFKIEVMLTAPYLAWLFEQTIQNQVRIINKISTENQEESLRKLVKVQCNQCFQSSHQIMKRVVSPFYEKNIPFFVECISHSPVIAQDYALFLCLDYIANNDSKLINENGQHSDCFRLLMTFISELIKNCHSLQFNYLLALSKQKLASPQEFSHFDQHMGMLHIVIQLIQTVFPSLQEEELQYGKYQYLGYGYNLKLELADQVMKFHRNQHVRQSLWRYLVTRPPNDGTLLFMFMFLINAKMKAIVDNQFYSITAAGKLMDFCVQALSRISAFFTYQMYELRRRQSLQSTSQQDYDYIFCEAQFQELIIQQQMQLVYPCSFLRAVRKLDLYAQATFKDAWLKAVISYLTQQLTKQLANLTPKYVMHQSTLNSFIRSEFFFNFWFCSQEHIFLLDKIYVQKSDELRKITQDKSHKAQKNGQISQKSYEKHMKSYELIRQQKNQLAFHYQRYNFAAKNIMLENYAQRTENTTRFTVPTEYAYNKNKNNNNKKGQQAKIKQFANLFFTHCLLPRLLMDPSEAVFCSRYLFRMIRENKMHRAFDFIFYVLEATISYVRYSTERQASKCLPVFVGDILRIFKDWDDYSKLQSVLTLELGMDVLTEKKHLSLKNHLKQHLIKTTKSITNIKEEAYQIKNCLYFLQKVDLLPLTWQQGEQFQRYLQKIKDIWQEDDRMQSVRVMSERYATVLKKRMKTVPSMKGLYLQREMIKPQRFPFNNPIICIDLQADEKTYVIESNSNRTYKLPIKFQTID